MDVVLLQDACLDESGIDYARWQTTVFLPLTLLSDGKLFVLDTPEAFVAHLKALEKKAFELGVTALKTRILSHVQPSADMAIISSIRDRLSKDKVIGSSSITWGLLRVGGTWKINQILFNDGVYNPSIVAQVFLGRPNVERRDEAPKAGG